MRIVLKLAFIAAPALLLSLAVPAMAPAPEPTPQSTPKPPMMYSLVRTGIWARHEWVKDYNLTFSDCVRAMWRNYSHKDGTIWVCHEQPDGKIHPA